MGVLFSRGRRHPHSHGRARPGHPRLAAAHRGRPSAPATRAGTICERLATTFGALFNRRLAAFVYMMTNRRNGVLYTGVTTNMPRRAYEHREGLIDGFTKRYGLKLLVYYEAFDDVRDAIQREKNIKHWPRGWKVRLIHGFNPEWADVYESLF
jgi:putative endonuclease